MSFCFFLKVFFDQYYFLLQIHILRSLAAVFMNIAAKETCVITSSLISLININYISVLLNLLKKKDWQICTK